MSHTINLEKLIQDKVHLIHEAMMHGDGEGRPPTLTKEHVKAVLDMLRMLSIDTVALVDGYRGAITKELVQRLVKCSRLLGQVRKVMIDDRKGVTKESGAGLDGHDIQQPSNGSGDKNPRI